MNSFLRFLQFRFIPVNADFALLALRLWIGLTLLLAHGWSKLTGFSAMSGGFPDPIGLGSEVTLALAVFVEVIASALLVVGLLTRLAALLIAVQLLIAFFIVHGGAFSGPQSGELAWIYAGAAFAVFFAGAGRFSVDGRR